MVGAVSYQVAQRSFSNFGNRRAKTGLQTVRFSHLYRFSGSPDYVISQVTSVASKKPFVLHALKEDPNVDGGQSGVVVDGDDVLAFSQDTFGVSLEPDLVHSKLDPAQVDTKYPQLRENLALLTQMASANPLKYRDSLFAYVDQCAQTGREVTEINVLNN